MENYLQEISEYIDQEIALLNAMDQSAIETMLETLVDAYEREATIYVFGNGGSASTASHMANDFNKGISEYTDKKFRVICLNDNTPTVLAVANDIGYDEIFRFQLRNKVKEGDLVIGISGSGNSKNVIHALNYAKEKKAITAGWVGFDGGEVAKIADVVCHAKINNMQLVEDIHMIYNHMMMAVLMRKWGLKGH